MYYMKKNFKGQQEEMAAKLRKMRSQDIADATLYNPKKIIEIPRSEEGEKMIKDAIDNGADVVVVSGIGKGDPRKTWKVPPELDTKYKSKWTELYGERGMVKLLESLVDYFPKL